MNQLDTTIGGSHNIFHREHEQILYNISMTTIAIDVDDVISSCNATFIDYHNKHYGSDLVLADMIVPGDYRGYWSRILSAKTGISEDEGERRFKQFVADDLHISGQPITDETKQHLYELSKLFRLEVITARDYTMGEQTSHWLRTNLPDIFNDIHFVNQDGRVTTKAAICKEIGAAYIIDDSVEHCNTASEHGITAILFGEYGWNLTHDVNANVIRAKNWGEVMSFFQSKHKSIDTINP